MKLIHYVPVYRWSPLKNSEHDIRFGTQMYRDLQDMYAFEYDSENNVQSVVGYFEVMVDVLSKEEFEKKEGK